VSAPTPNPLRCIAPQRALSVAFGPRLPVAAVPMRLPSSVYATWLFSLAFTGVAPAATPNSAPVAAAKHAAPEPRHFQIPAGDASDTLAAFSRQSAIALVYIVEQVRGIRTHPLDGHYTPREALERMLAKTTLQVTEDLQTGALIVKRTPAEAPPRSTPKSLSEKPPTKSESLTMKRPLIARFAAALAALAGAALSAQTASIATVPSTEKAFILNPFEVVSENDNGYQAANTLGATRTNTAIRDLPMQINVVTEQLMIDRALFDLDQVVDVIPGTARVFNEFVPQVNIRGFDSSAAMRNGVRGLTTPDMTSIARVETIKGPAALLYGQTQPGGVINYITKNPSTRRSNTVRVSFGSNDLRRAELDSTGPINSAKTLAYRLALSTYSVKKGERQRSLDRVVIAPMLQWKPHAGTSIVVRYSTTHDDIRPAEGLALKPSGALNRGGDPSYFYPFNNLDPVSTPQWVDELGPNFIKDSPSSYRDYKPSVWELESTQRLNGNMDLRANFAYHNRARSSIREGGTGLVNPWTQTGPTIASLNGLNSWNLDNTPGNPFPEAQHIYGLYGRNGIDSTGIDPLSDTRLLDGVPYAYKPGVATLQYTPGKSGWRRVNWIGNNRRETRINGQIDLITRFKIGPFENTLLTGFEHNEDRVYENNSTFVRDPNLGVAGTTLYTIPGTVTQVTNVVDYWYDVFSPQSTAARDAFALRNLAPLSRFASNRANNNQRFTSNSFYANWAATFAQKRGRLSVGGRFDDVSARSSTLDPGINPIGYAGVVTSTIEGARHRTTPQAGISYRVTDPISLYALYAQSVNPRIQFQPARTAARETILLTRYQQDGLPPPNLDALPWGALLEPEFGRSFEYGVKTDLFGEKVMINLAYYVIDKKNVSRGKPSTDPDSSVGFLDLSGAEQARGLDVDFYARPVKELQVGGGGLFNQTEIVSVAPTTVPTPFATTFTANTGANTAYSLLGRRITNAPKYSGNGYARYEFSDGLLKGLSLGLSYVYIAPRREGDTLRWSQSWSRWDLNAGFRTKVFNRPTSFSLAVKNATDRIYRVDRDTYAQGRSFVGTVSVEF
jgi:outer membrane receptor protein involved in Fe transport